VKVKMNTQRKLKIILTTLVLSYLPITVADNTIVTASRSAFHIINSEGETWFWGRNIGGSGQRITATSLVALNDFNIVKISAHSNGGAALTNDGKVLVWGTESLGDGVKNSGGSSPLLTPLSEVVDVLVTNRFTLFVKENGEVWGWGYSLYGILGKNYDEQDEVTYVPVQIQGLSNIIKISSQGRYVLALDSHGDVWSWGINGAGQLGNGTLSGDGTSGLVNYTPTKILGLSNIVAIETGAGNGVSGYSMALSADGNVFSWGNGARGGLGQEGTILSYITAPVQIGLLKNIKTISAGYHHALAISHNGEVWAWGGNYQGQVGDGTKGGSNDENGRKDIPIKLAISDIVAGAASEYTTAVIKADGSVWTWGGNSEGQMGINVSSYKNDTYLEPQQVIDSSLEFLNIGESNLSNMVVVDSNLNIQIPSASYQSSEGETNIWVNLDFKGVDSDGDYIWSLKNYGGNN